ncbi:MAG: hypothetical protein A2600_02480 [Candidatus Lambdaproteobacteria bacterium RIFOXYD1_FULL_56_27]|nr:MAG: hypothetical protein A2600_02480 [Candidatus Lambdaproteobacteria bacterium RIFOXYD1_FULL_56_27]
MGLNTAALGEQIQRLAGIDPLAEIDETFFRPTGNDHLAQFCLKNLAPELAELELRDQRAFLLAELEESLGLNFNLTADPNYAAATLGETGGPGGVQVVLDLGMPQLVLVHYLGEARAIGKLNGRLTSLPFLSPARLGREEMLGLRASLGRILLVRLGFEQNPKLFAEPTGLLGTLKGGQSGPLLEQWLRTKPELVRVEALGGEGGEGSGSRIEILETGALWGKGMRLANFLERCQKVEALLDLRYRQIEQHHLCSVVTQGGWSRLVGEPVRFVFEQPIERMDRFLALLGQGLKPLEFYGNPERLSPNLWGMELCDATGGWLRLSLTPHWLSCELTGPHSIPLFDRLEGFLAKQVEATLGLQPWGEP